MPHVPPSPADATDASNAAVWRALGWVGVLLVAALLAFAWRRGEADLVLAMAIFLAATLAVQLLIRPLPALLAFLLVVVALVNGAGGAFRWFEVFRWYDESVHTFSGFAGMAAIGFLYARGRPTGRGALVAWCTGMGLALALGWEVIEGLVGDLEAVDTATDVLLGTAGAALGGAFAWGLRPRGRLAGGEHQGRRGGDDGIEPRVRHRSGGAARGVSRCDLIRAQEGE